MNQNFASKRIVALEQQVAKYEDKFRTFSKVLQEIVGKELLRSQAVQIALIKKGALTDQEIVTSLQELIDGAKAELKEDVDKVEAEKIKAVELLVPANYQAPVITETPTPATGA